MSSVRQAIGGVLALARFHELRVESAREVGTTFRRIALVSDTLRGAPWAAGDKLQLLLSGAAARTYSPFAIDRTHGRLEVLAHVHGDALGANWARTVRPGETVRAFGPRGSLPLGTFRGPVVLVGDETSFGVARALREHRGSDDGLRFVFEVTNASESRLALADVGLERSTLVERGASDAHHAAFVSSVRDALTADSHLVLTGKAQSIQAVRASLKASPVPFASQKNKAYWAPGKRGLD